METTSKLESLNRLGWRLYVKHPKFRGEGTLFFRDGGYYYLSEFGSEIKMTEQEVKEILN